MFLYGMEIMGDGLKESSGSALKRVLEKLTHNVIMGVITGMLVTAVIQSSTATIVLTVGLISAGVLNLKQAASIVIGANIGTTVTAQIIRLMDVDSKGSMIIEFFKPSTLAPIAMIIGIILIMFIKKNSKGVGQICMGFGVLFSGLMAMTAAVEPLSQSDVFIEMIGRFSNVPLLGIIVGLVLTIIVQSSSAMVGMLQALSSTGVMTFTLVYPIIMGINLGTCVTTAMVCSIGSSKDAKRVGIVHILFNCIGTIVFMIGMTLLHSFGAFGGLWTKIVNSGDIANFQTIFNLITAVLLVPFSGLLVKASVAIVKTDKREAEDHTELNCLDEKLYLAPAMALGEAANVLANMGQKAAENVRRGDSLFDNYDENVKEAILATEDRLDAFADRLDNFLVGLARNVESEEDNRSINIFMQANTDFERIGDYATNIQEMADRLHDEGISFSETAREEMRHMFAAVDEITNIAISSFRDNNEELARRVEPLEEVIDDMVEVLKDKHIDRLKAGTCSISIGLVFVETLTYLERISDHCSNIGLLVLARNKRINLDNLHGYVRDLHIGDTSDYAAEVQLRREQFLMPLQ